MGAVRRRVQTFDKNIDPQISSPINPPKKQNLVYILDWLQIFLGELFLENCVC